MVAQHPEHEAQQSDRSSPVQTRLAILEQENALLKSLRYTDE